MKKKLLLLFACCILLGAFAIGASAADATEPTIAIKSGQLAFENTVYLQYAVEAKNVSGYNDVKLLVWLNPQDEYVNNGTQDYTLDCAYTFDNNGTLRGRYILDDLAASEMTVDVYTVAYYTKGGNEYYSPLIKYSMLQYIYNKLGYTGTSPSTDENYIALLENMLEYGAAAQTYFGENLDRLATNPFYELTVTNGFLADGTAKGLYCEGEDIVLVANPATDGQRFTHWSNSKGESVGTDETLTVKMGNKAETYTANYKNEDGIIYELSYDETYAIVTGYESTQTNENLTIRSYYQGKPVKEIADNAFSVSPIKTIVIPDTVTTIGSAAFINSQLTTIVIPNSVTEIKNGTFYYCRNLKSIELPNSIKKIGSSAFEGCALSYVNIPDGVISIGSRAFANTNLGRVKIPSSVTTIGNEAFLTSFGGGITYKGTIEQWYAIKKSTDITLNVAEWTVTCLDGTVSANSTPTGFDEND